MIKSLFPVSHERLLEMNGILLDILYMELNKLKYVFYLFTFFYTST